MKERLLNENGELALTLDEQAMLDLTVKANAVKRGKGTEITIAGRKWRLRPICSKQMERSVNLDFDVMHWQREIKETKSRRRIKRLNAKIRKAYARKAAMRWLGRWWFMPGLAWLAWNYIYMQSEEVSATINTVTEIGGEANFYLANLGCSKRQLVRSTMQVGDVYEDLQKRKQSADSMTREDVSRKKEDSRSDARSRTARTMKK